VDDQFAGAGADERHDVSGTRAAGRQRGDRDDISVPDERVHAEAGRTETERSSPFRDGL
jgi:hypothetical protein